MSSRAAQRKQSKETDKIVRELFQRFIVKMRGILKRCAPPHYARFPNARRPCRTCAFSPATDSWKGFDQTMLNMLRALTHNQPFYCHDNLPYKEGVGWTPVPGQIKLCAGYAIIQNDQETGEAFEAAVWEYVAANPRPGDRPRRSLPTTEDRRALQEIIRAV